MKIEFKQIGVIHSPYGRLEDVPCQPYKSKATGEVEVFKEYEEGLKDVEGFSHIIILYQFHKSEGYSLLTKPILDENLRGVFATRHPNRPNPIGISFVKLLERRGNILRVEGIDVLDGTPLIDIKPYIPRFDLKENVRIGWLKGKV